MDIEDLKLFLAFDSVESFGGNIEYWLGNTSDLCLNYGVHYNLNRGVFLSQLGVKLRNCTYILFPGIFS